MLFSRSRSSWCFLSSESYSQRKAANLISADNIRGSKLAWSLGLLLFQFPNKTEYKWVSWPEIIWHISSIDKINWIFTVHVESFQKWHRIYSRTFDWSPQPKTCFANWAILAVLTDWESIFPLSWNQRRMNQINGSKCAYENPILFNDCLSVWGQFVLINEIILFTFRNIFSFVHNWSLHSKYSF